MGFLRQIGESRFGEANIYKLDVWFLKLTLEQVADITASLKEKKKR